MRRDRNFTLVLVFNSLIIVFFFCIYSFMHAQLERLFFANEIELRQNEVELIGKSLRQSVLTGDYVGVRRVLQNTLSKSSIAMVEVVPSDGTQGICVGIGESCYEESNRNGAKSASSVLYFDKERKHTLATVSLIYTNQHASELTTTVSISVLILLVSTLVFVNVLVGFFLSALRKQMLWNVNAVRCLSNGWPAPRYRGLLLPPRELSAAFSELEKVLGDYHSAIKSKTEHEAIARMAQQVAHDIRSPLTALQVGIEDISGKIPESKRILLRSAMARIQDIANSLLRSDRNSIQSRQQERCPNESHPMGGPEDTAPHLLSSLIEELVSEKRIHYQSRIAVDIESRLSPKSYGVSANVQGREFKRLISNLINNSAEAILDAGRISVELSSNEEDAIITVLDTGKGIPPEVLPKLLERGYSHGKPLGNGLGLYHASTKIQEWGGSLDIESKVGVGTTVTIQLPRMAPPAWFTPELVFQSNLKVVILDDDLSIHQVWKNRIGALDTQHSISMLHVSTLNEFEKYFRMRPDGEASVYLIDYELCDQAANGLEIIRKHDIARNSYLVTSHYENKAIIEECTRLKVKLIPKSMAGLIPISFAETESMLDAVLVDKDPIIRMSWWISAKKEGKQIRVFPEIDSFLRESDRLARITPIYIDPENLVTADQREPLKVLRAAGFSQVFVTSLLSDPTLGHFGKHPPWEQKNMSAS